MHWEQMSMFDVPRLGPELTEGASLTVWRVLATGSVHISVHEFGPGADITTTTWEDAGPFDVPAAMDHHQDCLHRLKL